MLPPRSTYSELEQIFLADCDKEYAAWQARRRSRWQVIAWTTATAIAAAVLVFVIDKYVTRLPDFAFILCGVIFLAAFVVFILDARLASRPRPGSAETWQAHFIARGFKPGEVFEDPPASVMEIYKRDGWTPWDVINSFTASRMRLLETSTTLFHPMRGPPGGAEEI
jgi:hypothetical protein